MTGLKTVEEARIEIAHDVLRNLAVQMRDGEGDIGPKARIKLEHIIEDPDILEALDALGWRHEDDIAEDDLTADQAREALEQEPEED